MVYDNVWVLCLLWMVNVCLVGMFESKAFSEISEISTAWKEYSSPLLYVYGYEFLPYLDGSVGRGRKCSRRKINSLFLS